MAMSNGVAASNLFPAAGNINKPQQDLAFGDAGPWRNPILLWVLLVCAAAIIYWSYEAVIVYMTDRWFYKPEYSHAVFLPVISAFLIWQKSDVLAHTRFNGAWLGFLLMLVGAFVFVLGLMSTLYVIQQYALIVLIAGLVLSYVGVRAFHFFLVPLVILFLTIPLPNFLYANLSSELQLISSRIGVAVIRGFGIPVFLEGNVIDLGAMKLQVVEACAGLRYLFPLISLGFVVAHFFNVPLWMRIVTVISTIPITVLMNSARIGLIGVSVEYWGKEMAEGVLHDFEGWVVFMASLAVLLAEMWVLVKLTNRRARLGDVFLVELPAKPAAGSSYQVRKLPTSFLLSFAVIPVLAAGGLMLEQREEIIPVHKPLDQYPLSLDGWKGQPRSIDSEVLATLQLSDYFQADYLSSKGESINFYVAYYGSQRTGESAHSPRSCIPGGGWQIASINRHVLPVNDRYGNVLTVQRLLIQKGSNSQLVYYWFDQRGRVLTNEIMVKWYLFQDSLFKNRSDGALVRLVMPVKGVDDASIAKADKALEEFIMRAEPVLQQYLPQ